MASSYTTQNTTHKVYSYQKPDKNNTFITSARIDRSIYEAMVGLAGLFGYDSISKFVGDAISEKVSKCGEQIQAVADYSHSSNR